MREYLLFSGRPGVSNIETETSHQKNALMGTLH
jgi:hypothetical protein